MRQEKFWGIVIVITLLLPFAHADSNKIDKIFTIKGIETYHDSNNLENAKVFANNKAAIESFKQLVYKIIPISDQNKIYKITNISILKSVKKIIATKERMTNHSYMATVTVHFAPQIIKNILDYHGIRYKTEFSNKTLFIPIFFENKTLLRHDWRHKWLNLDEQYKLLSIAVFTNNLAMRLENEYACLFQPYSYFKKIAEEYNTKDLIIVFAEMDKNQLEFTIRVLNPHQDEIKYLIVRKNVGELNIGFLNRAINELLDRIDEEWKGIKSFNQNIVFTSKVKIKTKIPKVWSAIKQKLDSITELKNYRVTASSIDQMEVELNYSIPTPSFKELLSKHDIFIMKENDSGSVLKIKKGKS